MTTMDRDARRNANYDSRLRRYRDNTVNSRAPLFVSVSRSAQSMGVAKPAAPRLVSVNSDFGATTVQAPVTPVPAIRERNWWSQAGKRIFDIAFASTALLLLSPALLLIAALVKVKSPGPVFFRQMRHGRNCKLFSIYKFRTMAVDHSVGGVVMQTKTDDERISPIGAFLRRTSLDELPQLINVVRGEMSIVGPRPHAPLTAIGDTFFETVASAEPYARRYDVKPGITGLAQISGSRGAMWNRETAEERLRFDVLYVEKQNLLLDVKIIWKTFIKEFLTGKAT